MKSFSLSHLVLLCLNFFSCITAIPTPDTSASPSANVSQTPAQLAITSEILDLATELFGIQLVGAQTNQGSLDRLCASFNLTRLHASGYNAETLHQMFCQAASHVYTVFELYEIQRLTAKYSSYIWIFQAVGAVKNDQSRLKQLCDLINIEGSFDVGQDGTLVKTLICNAGKGIALPAVEVPSFTYDPADGPNGTNGQIVPPRDILELASDLFAVQLVGAKSISDELESYCSNGFDITNLRGLNYDISSIKGIICQAAYRTALAGYGGNVPPLTEVQALTVEYSTWIWIHQAVGVVKNSQRRLRKLCDLIDVAGSFGVGQNGTLVKTTICNAADGVALPEVPVPAFSLEGLNTTAVSSD